ncbi:MAG: hypothetical protein ACLR31_21410 [Escherichia coli]
MQAKPRWWKGWRCCITEGSVPDSLKTVHIRTLDLGLLQAGAGVKGEI